MHLEEVCHSRRSTHQPRQPLHEPYLWLTTQVPKRRLVWTRLTARLSEELHVEERQRNLPQMLQNAHRLLVSIISLAEIRETKYNATASANSSCGLSQRQRKSAGAGRPMCQSVPKQSKIVVDALWQLVSCFSVCCLVSVLVKNYYL